MRLRALFFGVLLATPGFVLGGCGLNPQPEIPSDTDDDAGTGAAGAPSFDGPEKHRTQTSSGSETSDKGRADPNFDPNADNTDTKGAGTPPDAGRPGYERADAAAPPPAPPPREAPDGGTGSVTM